MFLYTLIGSMNDPLFGSLLAPFSRKLPKERRENSLEEVPRSLFFPFSSNAIKAKRPDMSMKSLGSSVELASGKIEFHS